MEKAAGIELVFLKVASPVSYLITGTVPLAQHGQVDGMTRHWHGWGIRLKLRECDGLEVFPSAVNKMQGLLLDCLLWSQQVAADECWIKSCCCCSPLDVKQANTFGPVATKISYYIQICVMDEM